jgi:hypothetical protein
MSTQINVVVDGGGLVDRSKEQTQANRWAKAEADARQAALDEGLRQRDGRLQQDGRAPDGGPLYGSASDARSRLDEPVGRVNLAESMLMLPTSGPVNGQVPFKSRGFPKFGSVYSPLSYGPPSFEASSGPNGAPALVSDPALGTGGLNYVNLRGQFPYGGSTSRYKEGVKDFTLQHFVKLGSTYVTSQPRSEALIVVGSQGFASIDTTLLTSAGVARRRMAFTVDPGDGNPSLDLFSTNIPLSTATGPQLVPGAWHHCAICKSGGTVYAFFDGALIGQASVSWPKMLFTPFSDDNWSEFSFGNSVGGGVGILAQPVYLHGLKFEARAVYTAPFTPPPFLT